MNNLNEPATVQESLKVIELVLHRDQVAGLELDLPVDDLNSQRADVVLSRTTLLFHPVAGTIRNVRVIKQAISVLRESKVNIPVYINTQYKDADSKHAYKPEVEFALLALSNAIDCGSVKSVTVQLFDDSSLKVWVTPERDEPEFATANEVLQKLYQENNLGLNLQCANFREYVSFLLRKRGV